MEKYHVLLVDNEREFVDINARLLRLPGYQVSCYYDAPSALEAIKQDIPHVVLMDIAMPPIDGYEACRKLRSEAWGKNLPVIALTGFGREVDVQMATEAGFDRHLLKPVDLDILIDAIHTCIASRHDS